LAPQQSRAQAQDKKTMPRTDARPGRRNKREEVLRKASALIARHGFDGTSMRDIASAVDMLPGSLYYHFPSKEDMLLAIHERVVSDMVADTEAAIAKGRSAWDRLERAAVAHLKALLGSGNLVTIVSPNFAEGREELNDKLKAHRREYEEIFKRLFDEIPLPAAVDRRLLRLQLLGALNWVPVWYDPKRESSPETIAKSFVQTIRRDIDG
jgi:AcrR family transcriptional regulator